MQNKEKPGYPRFRSRQRYQCIEIKDTELWHVRQKGPHVNVQIKGLPRIRIRKLTLPTGQEKPRSIRIVRRATGCTVDLVYEQSTPPLEENDEGVGIDLGSRKRAALSTGETVAPAREDWKKIRRQQRKAQRCKRGSHTRQKEILTLARLRRKAAVERRDTCHRFTSDLIKRFFLIVLEDLNIGNMTASARGTQEDPGRKVSQKSGLNRSILEQAWGLIRQQLTYKAAWAGRKLVAVDPRYTSQDCSTCRHGREKPDRKERWRCSQCKTEHDRDVNAAINILRAGILALASLSSGSYHRLRQKYMPG